MDSLTPETLDLLRLAKVAQRTGGGIIALDLTAEQRAALVPLVDAGFLGCAVFVGSGSTYYLRPLGAQALTKAETL